MHDSGNWGDIQMHDSGNWGDIQIHDFGSRLTFKFKVLVVKG